MGCGWKRWKDEVGIERLKIVQAAWQEKTSVFSKVVRGAVWCAQKGSAASGLVFETQFVDYGTPEVEDSWIGRLWKWMSVTNLQLKLKGREAKVRCRDRVMCSCEQPLLHGQGSTKGMVARGCAKFGVGVR